MINDNSDTVQPTASIKLVVNEKVPDTNKTADDINKALNDTNEAIKNKILYFCFS